MLQKEFVDYSAYLADELNNARKDNYPRHFTKDFRDENLSVFHKSN